MSNTIRKFRFDDGWSIGRNESWFSDMAEKGFHLKSLGQVFVHFEKGEPRKTKYRIDILSSPPTDEQIEFYKECGWEYVTHNRDFYMFSCPESESYSELHTDPMEQGYTLTSLNKRLKNNLILISLLMVLFFGMMFSLFFLDPTPVLSMTDSFWFQRPLLILVELYVFYTVIRNYLAVHNLRKSLLEGKPINHQENWRKQRLIDGSIGIFYIFIALLTIVIPLIGIEKDMDYTLPQQAEHLPIIRLAELEQNPNLEREVNYNRHGVDGGNRVRYEWSILAPSQYQVNEHGIVNDLMWEDGSGKYSPSVETRYYELTFDQMADSLVNDLMVRYIDRFDPDVTLQEKENPYFDKVYIAEDGIQKQVFAYRQSQVIYVNYYGNVEPESITNLLPTVISNFNES